MANITIRDLDEPLERKLRLRAAEHNRSIEEEASDILRCALVDQPEHRGHLIDSIRRKVELLGGFDLELPPRGPIREPPDLS